MANAKAQAGSPSRPTSGPSAAHLCEERDEWNYDTAMSCEETESGKYSAVGTYICRHGEYDRPVYRIRKVPARRNGAIK